MRCLGLLLWIFSIATLANGQSVSQPQSPPPRIVNFLTGNLLKPEDVKFGKEFNAAKNWGFRLPCDAQGANKLEWRWQQNGTDIIFPNGQYKLNDDGSLTGNFLTAKNSGNYQCFVKDPTTNKETFSRKVQVAVTYVDDFANKDPIPLQVTLGDPLKIDCPPHGGSYGASYTWANKDNIQLNRDEHIAITPVGTLHIMFLTQADVDKISELKGIACTIVAANSIFESGLVTLNPKAGSVQEKAPSWESSSLSKSSEIAVEGRNKTLYCLALGRPAPRITWKKNGQQIISGENNYDIPELFFGRQLTIMDVKKDKHESPQYSCEAQNKLNSGNPLKHNIELQVQAAPRWRLKAPAEKLEVDIQGNGTLLCDVYADPVPSFSWYKDGTRIVSSNTNVKIENEKLRIENARMQEDGVYQCVAENVHGMVVSSTWIYIRAKKPTFDPTSGPFYLFKNSQGVLKCEPEAAPPPTFKWYRKGMELTTDGRYTVQKDGVLLINDVTEDDAGNYRCVAENFLDKAEYNGVATVYERTRITVRPEDKIVPERVNIDLRCRAEFDKRLELKYYWKRDDAIIKFNSKMEWLEGENVLKISDISVNDAGVYTCVAYTPEPKKSEDQASATVNIKGVPFPPTNLEINEETCINRTTVLKWTTSASNDAPILHFLIEQESNHEPDVFIFLHNVTNPNATSVVLNLTGWSTLRFRMRAVNSFGPSRPSLPTGAGICRTSQSAPEKFPENLRGVPKKAGELDIAWTPMPKVYWNGPGFYYILEYRKVVEPANEDSPDQWKNVRLPDQASTFKVDNPGYYELWEFRIRAGNNLGPGPFSAIERSRSGQDPPEGQPKNVAVQIVQARSAKLSWEPVAAPSRGSVDGYRIFYWGTSLLANARRRRRAIPSYANSTDVKGRTTSETTVFDLKPYTSYTMAIKAFNSGGEGPASDEIDLSTLQDVPGRPADVKVFAFALYILITWKPPTEPNGIITNYQAGSAKYTGSEPKDTPVEMTQLAASKRRHLIGQQEELTNYVVEIRAKTEPGYGESVRIATRTVKISPPAKHNAPTVVPTGIDKVRVICEIAVGGGYTHEFLVQYQQKLEGEEFVNSSWINYLGGDLDLEIGNLESALYKFRTIGRNDQGESPPSDITEARPIPGIVAGKRSTTPIHQSAWFIALLVLIAILLIVLLIFVLYTRRRGSKYPVGKREKKRAAHLIDRESFDEEEGPYQHQGDENPPPYQSQGSLDKRDSDRDSLDDYGEGPQFNEDGSFIEEYGDEKKPPADEKDQSAFATFV